MFKFIKKLFFKKSTENLIEEIQKEVTDKVAKEVENVVMSTIEEEVKKKLKKVIKWKLLKKYVFENEMNDIILRLKTRGVDLEKTKAVIDKEHNYTSFLLYNLSGKLVGYVNYNPQVDKAFHQKTDQAKKMTTDEMKAMMRYFSYVTKQDKINEIAVWELETVKHTDKVLFITEGIFDIIKIHNQGLPGIAVFANNPKWIKPWLSILTQKKIVIYDNDKAERKLAKLGDVSYTVPEHYNDLGDMTDLEVKNFLKTLKY